MRTFAWRDRRVLAWLAPLAVAGAVAGGTVVATAGPSTADAALPPISAQALVARVLAGAARPVALTGTLHESAALGLPSLPGDASAASLSWQQLITGSHDARVWIDGAQRQRIGVLGQLSEAEVVHNGTDLWTYTSATNAASHTVLSARHRSDRTDRSDPAEHFTPQGVAAQAVKAVTPSTAVTVEAAPPVAGHKVYGLVLRPKDARSTVDRVVVSVEARTYTPLGVQIFGAGTAPAFSVQFSKVSFARPAASVFAFAVPAGARVSKTPLQAPVGGPPEAAGSSSTRVLGSGWTSVLELKGAGANLPAQVAQLSTPIAGSADRLVPTALVNAVLRPDGTVFVGAVRPAALERIAATTR